MAAIRKINGKSGPSYKITVTQGRDLTGKQLRHFMTWTPPHTMTARQMEKEVQNISFSFEKDIREGLQADNRQTFSEYADYVLTLKERTGVKPETIITYRILKKRLDPYIGHIKLSDIRPGTLNQLYSELSQRGLRSEVEKAVACTDISKLLKDNHLSMSAAAQKAGISAPSLSGFCQGKRIEATQAHKLAVLLNIKDKELFSAERNMNPLSSKTILEHHRFISTVLDQAVRDMLVAYNAAARATPPRHVRKEVNYFQPEELGHILDALDTEPIKWRTITHLLIVTGARRGEIMGLKWNKVDLENGRITIDSNLLYNPTNGIYEGSTKTGTTRYVLVPNETIILLKRYRAWCAELRLSTGDQWQGAQHDLMFVRDNGQPMNPDSITAWLSRFSMRHELPHINPHAFRHSAASILIDSGADLLSVSKQL
ncbi:MAG: tyrosine-type recombinase/integrase, partial [Oscillospiraceae bacterium]